MKRLWLSLIEVFIRESLPSAERVYVAIDRTTWRDTNLLIASIVWKGRAIPLYWERLKTLGNSHHTKQIAFLAKALPVLAEQTVVVLGDREFCSVELARWLGREGHYFCLRQKKSTYVLIEDTLWLKLAQMGLTPGTKCFYNEVTVTKSKGFGPLRIVGKWKRVYRGFAPEEPWFLLTNLETLDAAVAAYQKRFDIEEMFRDFKLGGYRLEGCRAGNRRFMAVVLLVAIAYLCASKQGQRLKQRALQKYIARPETPNRPCRRHSFFYVGLAAHRWVPFEPVCRQQVQQLLRLNRGKIQYYLKGQKAMDAVLQCL
ncbi:MAG: IS4 family transposase [Cyanobacteria bacterium J06576_12]